MKDCFSKVYCHSKRQKKYSIKHTIKIKINDNHYMLRSDHVSNLVSSSNLSEFSTSLWFFSTISYLFTIYLNSENIEFDKNLVSCSLHSTPKFINNFNNLHNFVCSLLTLTSRRKKGKNIFSFLSKTFEKKTSPTENVATVTWLSQTDSRTLSHLRWISWDNS